jgi:hypothetical protein
MIKRPGHTWLKPVFDSLDGINRYPAGVATSVHGFYGLTGIAQLATGTLGITGLTGIGASGFGSVWFNGGSGAYYTLGDIVTCLKNAGFLKR